KELSYLLETIVSFHDTAKNPEAFYHGFLNGMLAILSPRTYEIQSNKESGYGRFDIALFPKRTDRPGVLMEFKAAGSLKALNAMAKAALAQTERLDYTAEFRKRCIRDVWTYGIAFRGKKVRIVGKNMGESQPKNSPIKP
ncbi:MAG: PD-(D/E)XK nuclease domain-containing protein, partial [Selenomonadaceae bacterium]|nr:PD-(D/E)XK nuclease domain-containing protein [Selenomonadaceae bacterium]